MMRRPRHLSQEERVLWERVIRQAEPLHPGRGKAEAGPPAPVPLPAPRRDPVPEPLPRFRVGERTDHRRSNDLLPDFAAHLGRVPVRMDAKTHGRMKKGKLAPEGRLDLHGMTLAEAHPALLSFILSSHGGGKRLVLVITGKGRLRDDLAPMPVRQGVLRHQVPVWLSMPPLGPVILQVVPAHVSHGGAGAFYVYLRRR